MPSTRVLAGAVLVTLLTLLVLTSPAADAASTGSFVLESPHALDLKGETRVEGTGGSAFALGLSGSGTFVFHNLTGTVVVSEWRQPDASTDATGERVTITYRTEPATDHTLHVVNATLSWSVTDEFYSWIARTYPSGVLHVAGPVEGGAAPVRLERDANDGNGRGIVAPGAPASVVWAWEAGWPFVARSSALQTPLAGGPPWTAPHVGLTGPGAFHMFGGNVTVHDANGVTTSFRLGNWTEDTDVVAVAGANAAHRSFARLVFEGVVGDGSVRGMEYGLGAPRLVWAVDGSVTWHEARGTVQIDGGQPRRVDGATVQAVGATRFVPEQDVPRITLLTPATHEGHGTWRAFRVNGMAVPAPAPAPIAEAAVAAGLLALIVTLLFEAPRELAGRALFAMYSRIAPTDLLKHPKRKLIHETVKAEPGIHMRELQRRVGAGWGGFRVHLRMLEDGGYVRIERQGGYTLVFPSDVPPQRARAPTITHDVTRAVFEALPEDGTPMSTGELVERVGISRQLLRYHLNKLRQLRLVTVARKNRSQWVERAREAVPTVNARK